MVLGDQGCAYGRPEPGSSSCCHTRVELFDRSKGVSQRSSVAFRLLHVSADIVTAAIDAHPRLSALPLSQRLTLPDHPDRKYSGGSGRKPRAHSERSALTQRTPARPAHHEIALMALPQRGPLVRNFAAILLASAAIAGSCSSAPPLPYCNDGGLSSETQAPLESQLVPLSLAGCGAAGPVPRASGRFPQL